MGTQFNDKINISLAWLVIKDPDKQKIEHKVVNTFLSISFNNSMIKINMSLAWLVIIGKKWA